MYEHRKQPLLTRRQFLRRMGRHTVAALVVLVVSLGMGILGYRLTEHLAWLDALLNASMILGGMGPVDPMRTEAGKLFASLYALFSGVAFLAIAGILIAPIAHRILHRLHLDDED
jgi:asparagine N-glycosylation enzyme membrane subunit Stt3